MNKQQMIIDNMAIVKVIARQYFIPAGWQEDILQEGHYGLCIAAEKYDPSQGVTFRSYAAWWVRKYICRAVHMDMRVVRIPRRGVSEWIYGEPLDKTVKIEEGEALTYEDLLRAEDSADGGLIREEDETDFALRLNRLSAQEVRILSMRYGLEGEAMSVDEIARETGLSKDWIWRMLEKSYKKMK